MKTSKQDILLTSISIIIIFFTAGCSQKWSEENKGDYSLVYNQDGQPLGYSPASGVKILTINRLAFKDLNKNGKLDIYEDWRLTADERAKDLASKMSVDQIAGLMLYSSHQAIPSGGGGFMQGGTYNGKPFAESGAKPSDLSDQQVKFLTDDNLRHVLVTSVESPETAARWNNNIQAFVEGTGLGIPVNISSDPRHGSDSYAEYNAGAGGRISMWPGTLGIAATFDPALMKKFGEVASAEYRALGITTALSPQIDLATEPRWSRFDGTMGEDPGLAADMARAYVDGFQTSEGAEHISGGWGYHSVNAMVKHWPGGGPEEGGRDGHYGYGEYAVYPGNNLKDHLKPYKVIMSGVDQFGGNNDKGPLLEAYQMGVKEHGEEYMRKRFEESAVRLLKNILRVGLFENPYLDPEKTKSTVGNAEFMKAGYDAQLRSVVMLKNSSGTLPLKKQLKVYIPKRHTPAGRDWFGRETPESWSNPVNLSVVSKYFNVVEKPELADFALVCIASPSGMTGYDQVDIKAKGNGYVPISLQYGMYKADFAREKSIAGGSPFEGFTNRSYKGKSVVSRNTFDMKMVNETKAKMGKKPVVILVDVSNPMVFSEIEKNASAILVHFGIHDQALMDIITGAAEPSGLMPFQMPVDMKTVEEQNEDTPGDMNCYVDSNDSRYDFGFGLNWKGVINDERVLKYKN